MLRIAGAEGAAVSADDPDTVAECAESCIRVFDVGLRAPFYSGEVIEESLELATVVKMNEIKWGDPGAAWGCPPQGGPEKERMRRSAERLLEEFPTLEMAAVTRGGHGSLLVRREEWSEHAGFEVKTGDPIGAGDAFTAAMTHYLLGGGPGHSE